MVKCMPGNSYYLKHKTAKFDPVTIGQRMSDKGNLVAIGPVHRDLTQIRQCWNTANVIRVVMSCQNGVELQAKSGQCTENRLSVSRVDNRRT